MKKIFLITFECLAMAPLLLPQLLFADQPHFTLELNDGQKHTKDILGIVRSDSQSQSLSGAVGIVIEPKSEALLGKKRNELLQQRINELQLALEKEKQKNSFLLREVNHQLPALLRRIKAKEQLLSELKQQLADLFSHYEGSQQLNFQRVLAEMSPSTMQNLQLQDRLADEKRANDELRQMRNALLTDALLIENLSQLLEEHSQDKLQAELKVEKLQAKLQELFQALGAAEDKIVVLHAENCQLLDSYHIAVQKKRKLEDELTETSQKLHRQDEQIARFTQDQEMQHQSLNHLVRQMRSPVRSSSHVARTHTVRYGDSLSTISEYYYGTPQGWKQIYEANRSLIGPDYTLDEGLELAIP